MSILNEFGVRIMDQTIFGLIPSVEWPSNGVGEQGIHFLENCSLDTYVLFSNILNGRTYLQRQLITLLPNDN